MILMCKQFLFVKSRTRLHYGQNRPAQSEENTLLKTESNDESIFRNSLSGVDCQMQKLQKSAGELVALSEPKYLFSSAISFFS